MKYGYLEISGFVIVSYRKFLDKENIILIIFFLSYSEFFCWERS